MPIKIVVVEDNTEIADELEDVIRDAGFNFLGICRNFRTAVRKIPSLAPDVIIMDIRLPDGSGIDCTAELKRLIPSAQIMMFTIYEDTDQIFRALEAGASGYILKSATRMVVQRSIRELHQGGVPMTSEIARKVIQSFRRPGAKNSEPTPLKLTPREKEVLDLLAKGHLSREIAERLEVALETVNTHLKHIYEKLHVRSRTEAVIKYMR